MTAYDENFLLHIDFGHYNDLDSFTLISSQDYNYGNDPNWFYAFRGGLYGMYARIDALVRHFYQVDGSVKNVQD